MKEYTIKLIFCLWLSVLFMQGMAQQTKIQYEYDEAGNRISRIQVQGIVRNQGTPGAAAAVGNLLPAAQNGEESAGLDVTISDEKVNLYPNPTRGVLTVTMKTYSEGDAGELLVMDAGGRVVYKSAVTGEITHVDLGNEPAGMYRINLKIGNKTGYYSVVKQ